MIYNDNIYKLIKNTIKSEERARIESSLNTITEASKSLPNLSDEEIDSCKDALNELNIIAERNQCPIIYAEEGQIIKDLAARLAENLKY